MNKPLMRPSDLRKAVAEWCAIGLAVKVEPDGTITVTPPPVKQEGDAFDLVDLKK